MSPAYKRLFPTPKRSTTFAAAGSEYTKNTTGYFLLGSKLSGFTIQPSISTPCAVFTLKNSNADFLDADCTTASAILLWPAAFLCVDN